MNIRKIREEAKKKRQREAQLAPLHRHFSLKVALEKLKSAPKQLPQPSKGKSNFEKIQQYKFFRKLEISLLDEIKSGSVFMEAARQRFESLINKREKAGIISTAMKQKILASSVLMKNDGP